MEIKSVEVTPVRAPLKRTVSGSHYTKTHRGTVVVRIETDEGVTGHIYSGDVLDLTAKGRKLINFLRNELVPIVEGEELFSVRALWEQMFERTERFMSSEGTDRWLYMHAIGAMDTALWDTVAKAADIPLYQLWGGYRDSVPIIAIGGYYEDDKTDDDLVAEMEEYESMGIAGVKLKVGGRSVERDLERLQAVREGMGEDFVIACDANQGYSAEEAVNFAKQAKQHDIRWLEEPVVWHDQYRGMREVRNWVDVPVVAGQSESTAGGCQRLLDEESVDILNFDASLAGGPTEWHRAAASASLKTVNMAHHEEAHLAMHLLASVPHGLYAEVFHPDVDPVWYDMVANSPTVEDGQLYLPDGPGLGLELDEDFIEKYNVEDELRRPQNAQTAEHD